MVYLGVNVPLVTAVFLLPGYHVYLWGLLGMGSAAAIVIGLVRNRPSHPVAWVCIALAVTTFATGDITYDVLTDFLHQSNPFPSLADVFYIATVPLLVAGLIAMVRTRRGRDRDTGAMLHAHHHVGLRGLVVDLPDPAVRARRRRHSVLHIDLDCLPAR